MNLSGHAVGELLRFYKMELEDVLVVVDDVDLELGRLRARPRDRRRPQRPEVDHRRARDGGFARLRIGVGRGDAGAISRITCSRSSTPQERADVDAAVARSADAAELFVTDGIELVMNRFNRKEDGE